LGSGGVSNSGALQVNRSDNLTLANDVSGTGALTKSGANTLTLSGALSYGGTTTISSGTLVLSNNAPTALSGSINGPGALRIEAVANDFTGAFSTAGWTFGSTLGGLTLGKLSGADGTGDQTITLPGAINMAGPMTVYGGDIALNATLTSTGGNINLYASGAVTQTGAITAAGLGLHGAGTFTLDNAANSSPPWPAAAALRVWAACSSKTPQR
jgi:autotransporter-associated beta strand protein